ncbi:MAG TPA: hypothetical protein DCG57_09045 [Candidatus Riflebacteria bacterium]|nr:hypothetical protein [Candidatus Riflebacteria bacterium]
MHRVRACAEEVIKNMISRIASASFNDLPAGLAIALNGCVFAKHAINSCLLITRSYQSLTCFAQ